MKPPGYKYVGIHISELAATGRERIGVRCAVCKREGRYRLTSLIERHGDLVLPHLLGVIAAGCPRRQGVAVMPGCQAVYADPVTVEEEAAIVAGRGYNHRSLIRLG